MATAIRHTAYVKLGPLGNLNAPVAGQGAAMTGSSNLNGVPVITSVTVGTVGVGVSTGNRFTVIVDDQVNPQTISIGGQYAIISGSSYTVSASCTATTPFIGNFVGVSGGVNTITLTNLGFSTTVVRVVTW